MEQVREIKRCLTDFAMASGQRIGYEKSSIYFSPSVSQTTKEDISREAGIPVVEDLGKYLGMHLVHGRHSKHHYSEMLLKVHKRLSGWKMHSLSFAGRVTLASSTLSSMPLYPMQTAQLPQSVIKDLDSQLRRCVWGSNDMRRQIHLVNWQHVCRPKEFGGQGIKKLSFMNQSFLIKLGWRLISEPQSLWSKLLIAKYGGGRELTQLFQHKAGASHIWRALVTNVATMGTLRWVIGDGSVVKFWTDSWLGDSPLVHLSLSSRCRRLILDVQ